MKISHSKLFLTYFLFLKILSSLKAENAKDNLTNKTCSKLSVEGRIRDSKNNETRNCNFVKEDSEFLGMSSRTYYNKQFGHLNPFMISHSKKKTNEQNSQTVFSRNDENIDLIQDRTYNIFSISNKFKGGHYVHETVEPFDEIAEKISENLGQLEDTENDNQTNNNLKNNSDQRFGRENVYNTGQRMQYKSTSTDDNNDQNLHLKNNNQNYKELHENFEENPIEYTKVENIKNSNQEKLLNPFTISSKNNEIKQDSFEIYENFEADGNTNPQDKTNMNQGSQILQNADQYANSNPSFIISNKNTQNFVANDTNSNPVYRVVNQGQVDQHKNPKIVQNGGQVGYFIPLNMAPDKTLNEYDDIQGQIDGESLLAPSEISNNSNIDIRRRIKVNVYIPYKILNDSDIDIDKITKPKRQYKPYRTRPRNIHRISDDEDHPYIHKKCDAFEEYLKNLDRVDSSDEMHKMSDDDEVFVYKGSDKKKSERFSC